MNRIALVSAFAAVTFAASPALAASPRTFVSGKGADTGTCAVSTPCRSFAYAITQTAAGGEILVLDSAGYGTVTITQAVSIVAPPGIEGAITAQSGGANGITINAGPSDRVSLRGLTLNGPGASTNGIVYNSGSALEIVSCVINNFNYGIYVAPSTAVSISISEARASFNYYGIFLTASGNASVKATINNTIVFQNGIGIVTQYSTSATIIDSIATNNSYEGYFVDYGSVARIGRSTVSGNQTGIYVSSQATASSFGDNKISGNNNDVNGSLTSLANR